LIGLYLFLDYNVFCSIFAQKNGSMNSVEYHWEADFFRQSIRIYRNQKEVGNIRFNSLLSSKATAAIENKSFDFMPYGSTKVRVEIFSNDEKKGLLKLNLWATAARLENTGWKWNSSTLRNRWSWSNPDKRLAVEAVTSGWTGLAGKVSLNESAKGIDTDMLLITGLYMHYYTYRLELSILALMILVVFIL
jgi:hypothetical protein